MAARYASDGVSSSSLYTGCRTTREEEEDEQNAHIQASHVTATNTSVTRENNNNEKHVENEKDGVCVRLGGCAFGPTPQLEPAFLRRMARLKHHITFVQFVDEVCKEYVYAASARATAYTWHSKVCFHCRTIQEGVIQRAVQSGSVECFGDRLLRVYFAKFVGFTILRMWMCHIPETILLLDRVLYLHETLVSVDEKEASSGGGGGGEHSAVSLVPLFDGALSPRMYGVLARRG